ncbi:MAG: hypothetical protein DMD73_06145 [Gemmatimonadetes bacterium]|nr:MAG: hypothetical protein DMD73_06145 [Gemmatimonadota bacterium]
MTRVLLVVLGLVQQQGTPPLRKSELVRLLATKARPLAEVVALVRRSCVTFHPSARDRADLRAAGADDAVPLLPRPPSPPPSRVPRVRRWRRCVSS